MHSTSRSLSLIFLACCGVVILQAGHNGAQEKDYQTLSLDDCLAMAREQNPVLSRQPGEGPGTGGGLPGGPVQVFPPAGAAVLL